jgi:putative transposase
MKRSYRTDLSDAEWRCIEPHLPPPSGRGRPKTHTTREILDAIFFYLLKSGCPWRLLSRDLEQLNALSFASDCEAAWAGPLPSAGMADSQSSKTTGGGGEQRGIE